MFLNIVFWFCVIVLGGFYAVAATWVARKFIRALARTGIRYAVGLPAWQEPRWITKVRCSRARWVLAVLCMLFAPVLFFVLMVHGDVTETEKKKRQEEALLREEERKRRAMARSEWRKHNRSTLYYSTMNGIVAVVTSPTYLKSLRTHTGWVEDGRWNNSNPWVPVRDIFIFVKDEGRTVLADREAELRINRPGLASGWWSDLKRFAEDNDIPLLQDQKLFVPFVNEEFMKFTDQRYLCRRSEDLAADLLYSQMPADIRPLPPST